MDNTKQVIELTDEFEGSVIRVFRRLEELLRQLAQVRTPTKDRKR